MGARQKNVYIESTGSTVQVDMIEIKPPAAATCTNTPKLLLLPIPAALFNLLSPHYCNP
jgi:hypothetical protein